MPLPNYGRKGCVSFEERIYKLIATNQVNSEEYNTWVGIFGSEKLKVIHERFKSNQVKINPDKKPETPDEHGWILVHPDEFDLVRTDDILEYGSTLPGGSIYLRLKSAIQEYSDALA